MWDEADPPWGMSNALLYLHSGILGPETGHVRGLRIVLLGWWGLALISPITAMARALGGIRQNYPLNGAGHEYCKCWKI